MNFPLIKLIIVSSTFHLLAACGSTPPSNYYLLTANSDFASVPDAPSIGVGPIEIPAYLNRNNLVYSKGGNTLQITEYERWAEPINDGMARVLRLNLAGLLQTEEVEAFPWPRQQAPEYGVKVNLLSLDTASGMAVLVAEWAISKRDSKDIMTRQLSQLQQPLVTNPINGEAVAAAYSQLLRQLSEIIAASISADMQASKRAT